MLKPGIVALAAIAMTVASCGASRAPASAPQPFRSQHSSDGRHTVAGVSWVAAGRRVRRECRQTADAVHYPVPCPTLLPQGMKTFPAVDGCKLQIGTAGGGPGCAPTWKGWIVGTCELLPGPSQHLGLQGAPRVVANPARAIDGPG